MIKKSTYCSRNHSASLTGKPVRQRTSCYLNLPSRAEFRAKGCIPVMPQGTSRGEACRAGCRSIPSCQAWTRAEVTLAGHSKAALIKALMEAEFHFHGWRTTVIIKQLYTERGGFLTSPTTFLLICSGSADISTPNPAARMPGYRK